MASTTIQIQVDTKIKNDTKKLFANLGLDISSATKMFWQQSLNTKSIPFPIRTENGFTEEQENGILKASIDASKNSERFKNVDSMMKSLGI